MSRVRLIPHAPVLEWHPLGLGHRLVERAPERAYNLALSRSSLQAVTPVWRYGGTGIGCSSIMAATTSRPTRSSRRCCHATGPRTWRPTIPPSPAKPLVLLRTDAGSGCRSGCAMSCGPSRQRPAACSPGSGRRCRRRSLPVLPDAHAHVIGPSRFSIQTARLLTNTSIAPACAMCIKRSRELLIGKTFQKAAAKAEDQSSGRHCPGGHGGPRPPTQIVQRRLGTG